MANETFLSIAVKQETHGKAKLLAALHGVHLHELVHSAISHYSETVPVCASDVKPATNSSTPHLEEKVAGGKGVKGNPTKQKAKKK